MTSAIATEANRQPFDLLLEIDRNSRLHAGGFPRQEEAKEEWIGIAFRVRESAFVAPMSAVTEVVTPLAVAQVPGVKPWVLGIANMRGNLLPIMDLQGFLYGKNAAADPASQRILVIRHERVTAGLLVDGVLGLRHFWTEDRTIEVDSVEAALSPYVEASFGNAHERYAVFSIPKLIGSGAFMDVTV